jgi:23S rRNA (uracil1939-C5)-methyltransferase
VTRYRNKGIFAVAAQDGAVQCGFFRERSHDLIPVDSCLIQNELSERAAKAVTAFLLSSGIDAYDEVNGNGTVRHVFCRKAAKTADAVVCVVSARGFGDRTLSLVSAIREACPEASGIVLNINKTKGNTVLSGDFYTLWGRADMTDELCGSVFSISPQAFFQINPPQAEKLYDRALEYAGFGELAFDLYCGAGTISLCLARHYRRVIGAEIVPEAIADAKDNAARNGIENAEFFCGDAGAVAAKLAAEHLRPDVVTVDPPRKGLAEDVVRTIAQMAPERVVYVSCDPATLARDVARFAAEGYCAARAVAVDMFPRADHVETVCLLYHKKNDFIQVP